MFWLEVRSYNRDPADTSANLGSTQGAIHVGLDLDVRLNGLPHHQRRWVETVKRELL